MVSEEFKKNVASNDIVTVRSTLLDYMIIDKSFAKFDEALNYAEKTMNVIEPSDESEKEFEKDINKWDEKYLNKQKVALMVCFSQQRIDHVKKVIQKVLGAEEISNSKTSENISRRKTGKTVLEEKIVNQTKNSKHNGDENKTQIQPSVKASTTTSNSRTGRKIIEVNNGDSNRTEENVQPIDVSTTTSNSRTGRKTIEEKDIELVCAEEEGHPVDVASLMIGGGLIIATVGGVTAGIGVAVAKPAIVGTGLVVAGVGGAIAVSGGVVKIVKNM